MLSRLCEQQAAIGAVLHCQRDLLHLEHSPVEWRQIEDLLDFLKPFNPLTLIDVHVCHTLIKNLNTCLQTSSRDREPL